MQIGNMKNSSQVNSRLKRIEQLNNYTKRLDILIQFMTNLLEKKYEEALILCMIGMKSEPNNHLMTQFYDLLTEKIQECDPEMLNVTPSEHSDDEIIDEETPSVSSTNTSENDWKKSSPKKCQKSWKKSLPTNSSKCYENDPSDDEDDDGDDDSSSSSSSSTSLSSEDSDFDVSECSSEIILNLRSKVVPGSKLLDCK